MAQTNREREWHTLSVLCPLCFPVAASSLFPCWMWCGGGRESASRFGVPPLSQGMPQVPCVLRRLWARSYHAPLLPSLSDAPLALSQFPLSPPSSPLSHAAGSTSLRALVGTPRSLRGFFSDLASLAGIASCPGPLPPHTSAPLKAYAVLPEAYNTTPVHLIASRLVADLPKGNSASSFELQASHPAISPDRARAARFLPSDTRFASPLSVPSAPSRSVSFSSSLRAVKMVEEGVLLGMGNPLLDISAVVDNTFLEK